MDPANALAAPTAPAIGLSELIRLTHQQYRPFTGRQGMRRTDSLTAQ
jgi:hypothetical protein